MEFENKLITGGVNPVFNCSAVKNNIFVYGCANQIYIMDLFEKNYVIQTLKGHKKRVNAVQFLEDTPISTLVSGSSDGEVLIWSNKSEKITDIGYQILQKHKMKGSITFIKTHKIAGKTYILVGDCEGNVAFLSFNNEEKIEVLDQINFPCTSIVEAGDFHVLDFESKQKVVISLGALDASIHMYTMNLQEEQERKFVYKLSLKGHNNCITATTFQHFVDQTSKSSYLILASASKYNYIRLHKIQLKSEIKNINSYDKKTSFSLDNEHQITLESVLYGHQDTIVSLQWGLHNLGGDITNESDVALLSASFDFSVIVWAYEEGIWISKCKLGQFSGNKHAYFNAIFSSDYEHIIAYSYTGAINMWSKEKDIFKFNNRHALSGNISSVTDLDWSSDGSQLVACSHDQTTRVYAEDKENNIWNEYSRAQIHGYDINSIKFLKLQSEKEERQYCDLLICGADEKVLRLLEPPVHYLNYLNKSSKVNKRLYIPDENEEKKVIDQECTDKAGYVQYLTQVEGGQQVLGLMTKQVQIKEQVFNNPENNEFVGKKEEDLVILGKQDYSIPPSEDFLEKHTLWPELNKFYGHGYEISCISSNNSGSLIVSACKSQTKDQCVILFYDPKNYQICDKLTFHNYTVMQLEFSHNDEYLGSVSRDRQFALFKRNHETNKYEPFFANSSHTRIIWSLSFSGNDKYVITAGRDKRVKIWNIDENTEEKVKKVGEKLFKQPVTACAFSQEMCGDFWVVGLGFENGLVEFYKYFPEKSEKECLVLVDKLPQEISHSDVIKRIKFRKGGKDGVFEVATCSQDHSVRLTQIKLK